MRNLKAWDPSAKRMNEIRGYVDNKDTTKIFYGGMGGFVSYLKDKIIILEGSGLFDKNGVEIFVGDIVKYFYHPKQDYELGEVKYLIGEHWLHGDVHSAFSSLIGGNMPVYPPQMPEEEWEIKGNIYENPELLK
jgi:hypothetical protein